ncbi:universal stress protein [Desulfopila sp. IMCC35006]|uniref:universal stress protein n=1 Tax=Desulfopila sp. IMCC35006 TaxID=2569542 RepID=UPI0010ACCD0D|nr:universal stress protein [Desulfopila sp. IMCC35006]TKB26868.1 universal stress protein [Desulfopila sp. IMCC35006]
MADWHNILIAVDEMDSSLRAVRYVAQIARDVKAATICLLHVYPEPPPDYHTKGGILEEYQAQRIVRAERIFARCLEILIAADITREAVYCTTHMAEGKTISDTVLEAQRKGQFGTVVTGKRGVSKAEEFLFGSISNALARRCNDFTTWIVG